MHVNNIHEEVLSTIRKIMRAIDLQSKKLMQNYGLTGPQLMVMKELKAFSEITPGILARNISVSQATVTSILDRLEKRALVERVRCFKDKRKVYVKLTATGFKIAESSPSLLQDEFVMAFQKLEDWEQLAILANLERVATMMNAKHIEAAPILVSDDFSPIVEPHR